jgi:hypothetical protein
MCNWKSANLTIGCTDEEAAQIGQAGGETTVRYLDELNSINFDKYTTSTEAAQRQEWLKRVRKLKQDCDNKYKVQSLSMPCKNDITPESVYGIAFNQRDLSDEEEANCDINEPAPRHEEAYYDGVLYLTDDEESDNEESDASSVQ